MNPKSKIFFPNDALKKMKYESIIFSPQNQEIAIVILSAKEGGHHIIRTYRLHLYPDDDLFHFVQELEAFQLETRREAQDFIDNLPSMSAIDMMLLLNPIPPPMHFIN